VPPQQTVLEHASLSFPEVRGVTLFVVHWITATDQMVGRSLVRVHPPHPLRELKTLAGEEPVGICDPGNVLRPLLEGAGVSTIDLLDVGFDSFQGKLAVLGPFADSRLLPERFQARLKSLLSHPVAVVCFQPPVAVPADLQPTYWLVRADTGVVIYAQDRLADGLAQNPRAQQNLVALARLARQPDRWPPQPGFRDNNSSP
jgi:hypothetical protein